MKNYKVLLMGIILSVVILVGGIILVSNSKSIIPQEPPEILITVDGRSVNYVIGKNIWNGSIFDRLDNFQLIIKENHEIIYVPIGKEFTVEFNGTSPDSIEITDEVIDTSGNVMFNNSGQDIPVELNKGKILFILKEHPATLLSSNTETFENGVIRGFRVLSKWGDNECEYTFVIKTEK